METTALPAMHTTLYEDSETLNSTLERQSRQIILPVNNGPILLVANGDDLDYTDVVVSSLDEPDTNNLSVLQGVLEFIGGVASGFALAQVIPWHLRLRSTVTKVFNLIF